MARALHLIQELGCGEVTATHFDCSAGASREGKRFTAHISRINAILGITVPTETILDTLRRIADIVFCTGLDVDNRKRAGLPEVIMAAGMGTRL